MRPNQRATAALRTLPLPPLQLAQCQHTDILPFSTCCAAQPIDETDCCGRCGEHTGFERLCADCFEQP